MRISTVLVFVVSSNIDPYLNSITHAVVNHGINRIVFLNIKNAPIGKENDFKRFMKELDDRVNELSKGSYLGERISETRIEEYIRLKEVLSSYKVERNVSYDFLKSNITQIITEYPGDCFIDLTGVPKRLAFDIFIAAAFVGIDKIVTFELKVMKRGKEALYHNLLPTEFEYVFLPKSEEFLGSIEKIIAKKNKIKLLIVVAAIILSIFVTMLNLLSKSSEKDTYAFIIITNVFSIFGGILPIIDAWGGLNLRRLKSFKIFGRAI